ncbi:hypothetical protein [Candidatus Protochlamydia sp. W-9]|uniref:hypothetical protein n=1 Tax=Candidatus Protochlamydia sp. W-9 TaxID=1785087 RepID=UPI00096A6300|nr:hypothetical protein [Candidatus Protochlamydia sp. W-9]
MERLIYLLTVLLFCFAPIINLLGEQTQTNKVGTLIVNYQTNEKGHRLDRVRFWLINENNEKTLYPKKDDFLANTHTSSERTVVISHLPIGQYRIEFVLPNADDFFEEIPVRKIILTSEAVLKVDQEIHIRHKTAHDVALSDFKVPNNTLSINNLKVFSPSFSYSLLPHYIFSSESIPLKMARFSLTVNRSVSWKLLLNGQIIHSSIGSITNLPIPPGKHYYVIAEELAGYTTKTIPSSSFDIAPDEKVLIKIIYQKDSGYVNSKHTTAK